MAKRAMGKGLSAILGDEIKKVNSASDKGADKIVGSVAMISVDDITPNPFQPRTHFNQDALVELAQSISELGIVQPITVRKKGDAFELISGERRLRASKMAGIEHIPAYVRLADDRGMLEMAIIENLQREDLDPIEIAFSYQRMMLELGLSQEEVATRLGKGRSTITNFIRLLKLPAVIQAELRDSNRNRSLSENAEDDHSFIFTVGHARALLPLEEAAQLDAFKRIIEDKMSVRQTENLVANIRDPKAKQSSSTRPPALVQLENQLGEHFNTKVSVAMNAKGKGKISIPFASEDELNHILSILNG